MRAFIFMQKLFETKKRGGYLEIFIDESRSLFLVCPRDIINPSLIKIDLQKAAEFGEKHAKEWTYIVDTTKVLFPNPLNLFYLSKIKDLPHITSYVIIAPNPVVRLLATLTSFIIRPNRVLKTREEL